VQQNNDGTPLGHSANAVSGNRGRVVPSYLGDGLSFALAVVGMDDTVVDEGRDNRVVRK
jgi:hypothetical protein